MAPVALRATRLGLVVTALGLAAACSEAVPTDPVLNASTGPSLNEQEGPTSGAKVCKVGPDGTYHFTASSSGGGTLLFTAFDLAAGSCEWIWVGTDPAPLTTITVTEAVPVGMEVASIEVQTTFSDYPTIVTGTNQVSFEVDQVNSATVTFTNREVPPPPMGGQGCTPGYWKQSQHFDSWIPTGYSTTQKLGDVFTGAGAYKLFGQPLSKYTLLDALSFPDDAAQTLDGAAQLLARAAVAALLNAGHPNVAYGMTTSAIVAAVDSALASKDRQTMLTLQQQLDELNNAYCPLN